MARPRKDVPRHRKSDWGAMVRAADGGKPLYYPIYRTSGRTFKERDRRGPRPGSNP